jgi:hypothetical protein
MIPMFMLPSNRFPKVDGWKVIHNFLQKYFIYKKYGISLHPSTRWQRLKKKIFPGDAHLLDLRLAEVKWTAPRFNRTSVVNIIWRVNTGQEASWA